jgi:3-demethoxyubiquinol 3-hydroxylase
MARQFTEAPPGLQSGSGVPGRPPRGCPASPRRPTLYNVPMVMPRASGISIDSLLTGADNALRALFAPARSDRPLAGLPDEAPLAAADRRHVAGLMRVNHAGEISAQALYHGQALLARSDSTRDFLLQAAAEEGDHLAWCEQRLGELGSRTSLLNPFWYAGAFAIGAAAAAASDKLSLGFLRETERQVEGHLDSHLEQLPEADLRSRHILERMRSDEVRHGDAAAARGGPELPSLMRALMRCASQVMTRLAYWI